MPSVKSQLRDLKKGKPRTIEEDNKIKQGECLDEIKKILNQYNCVMIPELVVSGNGVQSRVRIMVKPSKLIILPGGPQK